MRKLHFAVVCVFVFALVSGVQAQIPKDNPVVDSSLLIGQKGFGTKSAPAESPTVFKPTSSRVFVNEYVRAMVESEEERKALKDFLEKLMSEFDTNSKAAGFANDASAGLAISVLILHSIANGTELNEEAFPALTTKFQSFFAENLPKSVTDRQKQAFYEWAICSAGFVLVTASAISDEETARKVKTLAETQLRLLTGAKLDQFNIKGKDVSIRANTTEKPAPNPSTASSSNAMAPGFSHSTPPGWQKAQSWFVKSTVDSGNTTTAAVRIIPAVPAQGNMGDTLRALWKKYIPSELANAAGGMVYRRYVGNKLFTQFIFGKGTESGRRSDTIFSLFLIDCGKVWQPVIVAQKYDSDTNVAAIEAQGSQYSYNHSAAYAEEFLKGLQCSGAPNIAVADRSALVGDYKYGSGSNMSYVNIYTGATSMAYVSYGGTLNLASDGTFTYKYSSASGTPGAANFRGINAAGKWTVQGDLLTCTYTKYDQGDGYFKKEQVYRIAGVTSFSDGVKVAVLISELDKPVNCTTVGDSSQWYSTKK